MSRYPVLLHTERCHQWGCRRGARAEADVGEPFRAETRTHTHTHTHLETLNTSLQQKLRRGEAQAAETLQRAAKHKLNYSIV